MLAITGFGSAIAKELVPLVPAFEEVVRFTPERLPFNGGQYPARYLFCAGYMAGERIDTQDEEQLWKAWSDNFSAPAAAIETIMASDPDARVVVMGSESGLAGSYDAAYGGAKAAMHRYVESKRLSPGQQLVCLAPNVIRDAGMTQRREDQDRLEQRRKAHPKERFCTAAEVARLIHFLLYVDAGYISGVTIRMNGGEHASK